MSLKSKYLTKISNLRVNKSNGIAPHKPLLILIILDMIENNKSIHEELYYSKELVERFNELAAVTKHRRPLPMSVLLPLYHLSSDGFWTPFKKDGTISKDPKTTRYVESDEFFMVCKSKLFREEATEILIKTYFEPKEQTELKLLLKTKPERKTKNENKHQRNV